jgi:hypothetical protein
MCRYNTVHVPCGISIQTSPVALPLDGWGARMCDLKGPIMNLFKAKDEKKKKKQREKIYGKSTRTNTEKVLEKKYGEKK